MSPSKTERKPNEKIKTDKCDACKIARLFRNGDITQVRIPPASKVWHGGRWSSRVKRTRDVTRRCHYRLRLLRKQLSVGKPTVPKP